jgi:hypothetical protein
MLPWFFRYDHTNYARWGAVYLGAIPDFGPDQPDYTWYSTLLQQSFLLEIPAGFQQVAELHLQDRLLPILHS